MEARRTGTNERPAAPALELKRRRLTVEDPQRQVAPRIAAPGDKQAKRRLQEHEEAEAGSDSDSDSGVNAQRLVFLAVSSDAAAASQAWQSWEAPGDCSEELEGPTIGLPRTQYTLLHRKLAPGNMFLMGSVGDGGFHTVGRLVALREDEGLCKALLSGCGGGRGRKPEPSGWVAVLEARTLKTVTLLRSRVEADLKLPATGPLCVCKNPAKRSARPDEGLSEVQRYADWTAAVLEGEGVPLTGPPQYADAGPAAPALPQVDGGQAQDDTETLVSHGVESLAAAQALQLMARPGQCSAASVRERAPAPRGAPAQQVDSPEAELQAARLELEAERAARQAAEQQLEALRGKGQAQVAAAEVEQLRERVRQLEEQLSSSNDVQRKLYARVKRFEAELAEERAAKAQALAGRTAAEAALQAAAPADSAAGARPAATPTVLVPVWESAAAGSAASGDRRATVEALCKQLCHTVTNAEAARAQAEAARAEAEAARVQEEEAKADAEVARVMADAAREQAEASMRTAREEAAAALARAEQAEVQLKAVKARAAKQRQQQEQVEAQLRAALEAETARRAAEEAQRAALSQIFAVCQGFAAYGRARSDGVAQPGGALAEALAEMEQLAAAVAAAAPQEGQSEGGKAAATSAPA